MLRVVESETEEKMVRELVIVPLPKKLYIASVDLESEDEVDKFESEFKKYLQNKNGFLLSNILKRYHIVFKISTQRVLYEYNLSDMMRIAHEIKNGKTPTRREFGIIDLIDALTSDRIGLSNVKFVRLKIK